MTIPFPFSTTFVRYCLVVISFCNWIETTKITAQNLINNGSFEQTADFEYDFPFSAFPYLRDWKAASYLLPDSNLFTTPDLFVSGADLPTSSPPTFWTAALGASDGVNYVGLTNEVTRDGAFFPETITTELTEQLETGAYYVLKLDYRNKGRDFYHPSPMMCIEEAQKKLLFYFDDQPISVSLDPFNNISISSAEQLVEIQAPSMRAYELTNWEEVGSCFQAAGNERHLALSMATGRVAVYPPCNIVNQSFESFLQYYFDVDNIRLEKLPESYRFKAIICENQGVEIDLRDSIDFPIMQSPLSFLYNGLPSDGVIPVDREGTYQVLAQFDCGQIPVFIEVTSINCRPAHYAPNAFSPNFDGVNDNWQILLRPDASISDFQLTVFDRWGGVIFFSKDDQESWAGNYRGKSAEPGTYLWTLTYTFLHPELGPLYQQDSGSVLLVR